VVGDQSHSKNLAVDERCLEILRLAAIGSPAKRPTHASRRGMRATRSQDAYGLSLGSIPPSAGVL